LARGKILVRGTFEVEPASPGGYDRDVLRGGHASIVFTLDGRPRRRFDWEIQDPGDASLHASELIQTFARAASAELEKAYPSGGGRPEVVKRRRNPYQGGGA
jgi:hypothetical protein